MKQTNPLSSNKIENNNWPLMIISLVNLFLYRHVLFTTKNFVVGSPKGDIAFYFNPIREFAKKQLLDGQFPFWNPYTFNGHPYMADPETCLFYPFTYLFLILPTHLAFSWSYFTHSLIAGFGIFFLCRQFRSSSSAALCAAIIFSFSAPKVLHMYGGHFTMELVLAWTPWLIYLLDKFLDTFSWKTAAWLGLLLGIQLLGGFPLYSYLTGWILLTYGLFRYFKDRLFSRTKIILIRLGTCLILGVFIFAVQAVPSKEFMDSSTRFKNDLHFVGSYSLEKENLITFLFPKYFGKYHDWEFNEEAYFGNSIIWENVGYMGIISIALLLGSITNYKDKNAYFWWVIFIIYLLIAFGQTTPLFKFCFEYIPGFSFFRGYSKSIALAGLALAILAAKGFDSLTNRQIKLTIYWRVLTLIILASLIYFLIIARTSPDSLPFIKDLILKKLSQLKIKNIPGTIRLFQYQVTTHIIVVTFIFFAGWFFIYFRDRLNLKQSNLKSLIVILCTMDFVFFASPYYKPLNLDQFSVPKKLTTPILKKPTRVVHGNPLVPNLMMVQEIRSVGGFSNFTLREYSKLASFLNGSRLDAKNNYLTVNPSQKHLSLLGANFFLGPKLKTSENFVEITSEKLHLMEVSLYNYEKPFPPYYITRNLKLFPLTPDKDYSNPIKYSKHAKNLLNEFPETIYVRPKIYKEFYSDKHTLTSSNKEKESITLLLNQPARKIFKIKLNKPGFILVNENYYSGWHGKIDGKSAQVIPANLIMKAIKAPEGIHEIEFYFVPTNFWLFAIVSTISLIKESLKTG